MCVARSWASSNPTCISEAVRSVCLKRGLCVLERGKCVCLVLDLENSQRGFHSNPKIDDYRDGLREEALGGPEG